MGGVGSGYLNLASNIYTITAYTEENKEITETDKPISVTIINSANPAEESYIGILEKGLWNFTCVYPPTDSSVRADFENNSQIDIYKLGVSVAVFVRNSQATKAAVITEAEAASSTINLKTANNKYAEDLPIELTLKGNPEATDMTLSDYYIRIRYQNKNKEDAKFTVNGGKAQITTDQENLPALSGLYSHEITITEINPEILGRYMIASFSLGLKGKKLSDFSDKLVITVSNTPKTSLLVSQSRAAVGSSAKISFGSFAKALAIATRCFSPPLKFLTLSLALFFKPTISKRSNTFLFFLKDEVALDTSNGKAALLKTVSLENNLKS